jgi:hypothetical protein
MQKHCWCSLSVSDGLVCTELFFRSEISPWDWTIITNRRHIASLRLGRQEPPQHESYKQAAFDVAIRSCWK